MAIVVDKESSYKGERKVRNSIEQFFSDDVVVYNNREVNGREYDLCVLMENRCIFIIEVKGWLKDKIIVHGIDDIEVEGYTEHQTSPKKQAKSYLISYMNKIKRRYGKAPLIVDLVAYPFITKSDYYEAHLNNISEEQFTILKEDVENKNLLHDKFLRAYNAKKSIPHAELSNLFFNKIRNDEEPAFNYNADIETKWNYSVLSIYPNQIDENSINGIIKDYFKGMKQLLFVANRNSFEQLLYFLNETYKKENIEPNDKLKIGYKKGISDIETIDVYRSFNFELYYVPNMDNALKQSISIYEGEYIPYEDTLVWLAAHTTFNFEQYKVEHATAANNILVEAGAGTGKTFSMVSRVAYLCHMVKDNISDLENELAMVTFTNDAAINMKSRLKQMFLNYYILTGDEHYLQYVDGVERSNICTIHKFSLQLLRGASFYTGLGTNFKISSDEYSRGQIYDIYLSQFLEEMEDDNPEFINQITVPIYDLKKKIIGIADNLLQKSINLDDIKPEEMGIPVYNTLPYFNEIIQKVIIPSEIEYLNLINDRNAMDLKESIILLNKVLDIGSDNINNLKLRYIFIDEFQDTDDIQIEVFKKLQKSIFNDCRLFIVGDLKQSIYRFRGAKLSAFDQIKAYEKYKWDIFHLNINYRTDKRLLDLYHDIFSKMGRHKYLPYTEKNDRLKSEKVFDLNEEQLMLCVPCHGKDAENFFNTFFNILKEQVSITSNYISTRKKVGKDTDKKERTIAILVRSNWQVDTIVKEAQKRDIYIETKSGGDLFQLESTQDLYKLILAIENPLNPVYLVNFINSNYTDLHLDYQKLHNMSVTEKLSSLQKILDQFFEIRMGINWKNVLEEVYEQPVLYALKHIYDALKPWKQYGSNKNAWEFYASNYEYLLEKIIKYSRIDALTIDQISKYLEINILTEQKELARNVDSDDEGIKILCTTVHKSKGLEYGTVILPYTAEDISDLRKVKLEANYSESKLSYTVLFENKVREKNTNYQDDIEQEEQISEESRVLYVALTRAIRNCVWIHNIDRNASVSWAALMEE